MPIPLPGLGLIAPNAPRIPTAARTYLDSVVLGRTDPITEKNFTPQELAKIRQLTQAAPTAQDRWPATPGAVTYSTYKKLGLPGSYSNSMFDQLQTPQGNIENTLGQFNYRNNPNTSTIVTDRYKFNPGTYGSWNQLSVPDKLQMAVSNPYAALRTYAGSVLPAGSPNARPVNITLPPTDQLAPLPPETALDRAQATISRVMTRLGINTANRGNPNE